MASGDHCDRRFRQWVEDRFNVGGGVGAGLTGALGSSKEADILTACCETAQQSRVVWKREQRGVDQGDTHYA
jgi:hypothetical protein